MSDSLALLGRCPFCPTGRGVVAVDPHALRFRPERMDFLVFDPDRAPAGPCAHLIQFGVSVRWEGWAGGSDYWEFRSRCYALSESGPDHALGDFLWGIMAGPLGAAFVSATPFRSEKGYAEGVIPDRPPRPGWEWFAALDALFAADATRFVEECQAHQRRVR